METPSLRPIPTWPNGQVEIDRSAGPLLLPDTYAEVVWNAATSWWAEPAAHDPPPRVPRDWILATATMLALLLEAVFHDDLVWRPIVIALGCGLPAAILFRRTHGLIAAALAFGTFAVLDVATWLADAGPVRLYSGTVVIVLVYALFRWASSRDATIGSGFIAAALIASVTTDFTGTADAIGGVAVLLFTAALGVSVRARQAAREQLVEQAKLQERAQLARELHDTVAHHVSAIAIQAQAGLVLARSSSLDGAVESLEIIDREAARTLAEMRTMVGALRDRQRQPTVAPPRGLADIEHLAASGNGSVPIDVELGGELVNLPPALEAALYRVAAGVGHQRPTPRPPGNPDQGQRRREPDRRSIDGRRRRRSPRGGREPDRLRPDRNGRTGRPARRDAPGRTSAGWRVARDGSAPPPRRPDMTIRVIIADDQSIVRAGLATILGGQPDIEVVGQAADGREAVALARELRPDVCLFDIRMPNLDGIEATRLLAGPGVTDPIAVVVITTFDTDEYVYGALEAGARGFLLKGAAPEQLVQAIHAAVHGDALIDPGVTARLLAAFSTPARRASPIQPVEPLTDREEAVLRTVARGRTNAEIGAELHISTSTVKFHVASLMTKLGVRNRVELAMWAYETNRVGEPNPDRPPA